MVQKGFEYMKRTLSEHVITNMMELKGWSEDEAICRFMKSEVYNCLQDESTKVWHYSPYWLTEMYKDELEGKLEWFDP